MQIRGRAERKIIENSFQDIFTVRLLYPSNGGYMYPIRGRYTYIHSRILFVHVLTYVYIYQSMYIDLYLNFYDLNLFIYKGMVVKKSYHSMWVAYHIMIYAFKLMYTFMYV
jgi:hypothetical protein